jgi:hypothetical protein
MPDGPLRQAKNSWTRNTSKRTGDRSKKPDHVDGSYRQQDLSQNILSKQVPSIEPWLIPRIGHHDRYSLT